MKEKRAYEILQHAQGILIPKVWFLASFSGIIFLGLQLGRTVREGEDISGLPKILDTLKSTYGFFHDDCSINNCIFIKDRNKEKLVVIDLEEYQFAYHGQKKSISQCHSTVHMRAAYF